jgi:hypothetical protein
MAFIEESSSTLKEGNLPFTKSFPQVYCHIVVIVFIEGERFHDKRRKFTVYENDRFNFLARICF